ncbi:ABC transporter ATP-binding protein [Halegenticoccus tardaugens]|uniref:ABC transporter ATP-binding protein n=1 Tax=Halegenticoccus tardaugens TaxID=2071624 RepID=UPI00100C1339|nr:ABC transporter ATP-binding protein [Halegenticoccus tardaugens]
MSTSIHLENLRKEFRTLGNTHVAVDDLTLDVPDGSFTTFVGPSGCGKTTTLRMLAGLETPTAGRIAFGDRDVTDLPPQRRNVAMVFQSIALYPHMTVRANIGYGLKVRGVPKSERDARIEEAAETLQITEQLEKMPAELSGGQQQRVALGGAFVQDPDVLLLDEPMSDLDAKLKSELRVEIQRLHQELETTIVYVTHDQTEAMTMSDQVVLLREGELAQADPPRRLFDRPRSEYVARFIGTPSTNVLDCRVERSGSTATVAGHGFRIPLPADALPASVGDAVRLGIRPQFLAVDAGEHRFEVTVEVVEPIGIESVVHGRTDDGTRIDVVATGLDALRPGDRIAVGFDRENAFVFDADGESAVFGDELADDRERSIR